MPGQRKDSAPSRAIKFFCLQCLALLAQFTTVVCRELRVGTWNILGMDDEYNPNWGCPLQIALCNMTRQACARQRYERIWNLMENSELDVFCLQEVNQEFTILQPNKSKWTIVAQSGGCAVYLSTTSDYQVTSEYNVTMSGLSTCLSVPVATFNETVAVASVHVQASVVDMDAWYDMATTALRKVSSLPHVVGGDYNHNLTAQAVLPLGWALAYATDIDPLNGTTQKEFNWMGNFDGFLVSSQPNVSNVDVAVAGFMPKVVRNLPQGGVNQTMGQFDVSSEEELLFSVASSEPFKQVPLSNPRTQALSDHLLVSATFGWTSDEPSLSPNSSLALEELSIMPTLVGSDSLVPVESPSASTIQKPSAFESLVPSLEMEESITPSASKEMSNTPTSSPTNEMTSGIQGLPIVGLLSLTVFGLVLLEVCD